MKDNFSKLARLIWEDEPEDYGEMEEGRKLIERLFLAAPELLMEGKTFGEVRGYMEGRLPPLRSLILELIPEDKPFHCSPGERPVRKGELITVDCALRQDKLWVDRSVTLAVGAVDEGRRQLLQTARRVFVQVREASRPGASFGDIARMLGESLSRTPCRLVPGCGGHGIGTGLHQGEDYIYSDPGEGQVIQKTGAFTVEPVICLPREEGPLYAYFEDTLLCPTEG